MYAVKDCDSCGRAILYIYTAMIITWIQRATFSFPSGESYPKDSRLAFNQNSMHRFSLRLNTKVKAEIKKSVKPTIWRLSSIFALEFVLLAKVYTWRSQSRIPGLCGSYFNLCKATNDPVHMSAMCAIIVLQQSF